MTAPKLCAVKGCGRPVRARGVCGSHYRDWKRREDAGETVTIDNLRPLRGPGGRIGEVALETVIVRLSPDVIAELDRVQGKKKRAETMRLVLAIWASRQARKRDGAGAAADALGRMADGYGGEGREVPIDLEKHAPPEEIERRREAARAFLGKVMSPKRKREQR